jgi:hypothetical protein
MYILAKKCSKNARWWNCLQTSCAKSSKDGKGKDSKHGKGKDSKDYEDVDGKVSKDGEGKDSKDGEGKDSKDGGGKDSKDGGEKGSKDGGGKGSKDGEGKDSKDGGSKNVNFTLEIYYNFNLFRLFPRHFVNLNIFKAHLTLNGWPIFKAKCSKILGAKKLDHFVRYWNPCKTVLFFSTNSFVK